MSAEPPRRDREVVRERPAERETVVREGGSPFGVIAIVVGVILVLLLAWLLFFRGADTTDGVEVDVPDQVEVDVDEADGAGGGDGSDGGDGGTDVEADVDADVDAGGDGGGDAEGQTEE